MSFYSKPNYRQYFVFPATISSINQILAKTATLIIKAQSKETRAHKCIARSRHTTRKSANMCGYKMIAWSTGNEAIVIIIRFFDLKKPSLITFTSFTCFRFDDNWSTCLAITFSRFVERLFFKLILTLPLLLSFSSSDQTKFRPGQSPTDLHFLPCERWAHTSCLAFLDNRTTNLKSVSLCACNHRLVFDHGNSNWLIDDHPRWPDWFKKQFTCHE